MTIKPVIIAVGVLVILGGLITGVFLVCEKSGCFGSLSQAQKQKIEAADTFEHCAALGFPITESTPPQCRAGDKLFSETIVVTSTITGNVVNETIRVTTPLANAAIQSPVMITGDARGSWYFEGSFPIRVLDANGNQLARTTARAKSNWMTIEFVPFEATLTFDTPPTQTGTLVLEKDNPSGLPGNADAIFIPIRFGAPPQPAQGTGTLRGTMTIGPVCPVEQVDKPCKPTAEMLAARKIFVYASNRTSLIATLTPDGTGNFSASLPQGEYWVDMAHQRVGGISGVPTAVHMIAGGSVTLTIDIDTGIR